MADSKNTDKQYDLIPQRRRALKKCGVPPEEQIPGKDCCFEEITKLMETVWNQSHDPLGCQVKQVCTGTLPLFSFLMPSLSMNRPKSLALPFLFYGLRFLVFNSPGFTLVVNVLHGPDFLVCRI